MSYEQAAVATVSRAEAAREIKRHGIDPAEFFAECGDRATYAGRTVLRWLGY